MSSPRILIVRTSALGDIVQALPVLKAVRRHYEDATVGWVVEEAFAPLLRQHPLIDELLEVRLRSWRKHPMSPVVWRELAGFLRRLHGFEAEIVLDLMGNHKAGIISALTLADRRIGLDYRTRREPSSAVWMSERVTAHGEHAVERMLAVAGHLTREPVAACFAPDLLPEAPTAIIDPGRRFVLLHPFTGWPNKDYPLDRWAVVARALADEGVAVAVTPGPGEEQAARDLAQLAGDAVELVASPTLPELVFLQRRAALVLGGDTGPVHLAHALGTRVVCVMGPTDPECHGPYGAAERAVWTPLPCSFCHKKLPGVRACLLELDPRSVADKALESLRDELH